MKRSYELTVVVRVDPNPEVVNDSVDQVKKWVEADELGAVTNIDRDHWGRRRLAYEIDKQRDGYFVIFYADLEPKAIHELERNLKLSPAILRYLLIRAE